MAGYYYSSDVVEIMKSKDWCFDTFSPSDIVPFSGIYKCKNCGKEITSNKGDKFPPQNYSQHTCGNISWELIVRTDTMGDNFGQ